MIVWPSLQARIEAAANFVQHRLRQRPTSAVIVGSGLGEWIERIDAPVVIPFERIPGLAPATAAGHRGELIAGVMEGQPIVVLAGRLHRYEGHDNAAVMFPVWLLARLGAPRLIVTSAAGGLNRQYEVGDLVVLTDHINWMPGVVPLTGRRSTPLGSLPGRHGSVYDQQLARGAIEAGLTAGFVVHRGTYLATLGPNFETRAEYRMMRRLGADLVGMSTVPEVLAGIDSGMRVLAVSMVSNLANPDRPQIADHQEVLQAGRRAAVKIEGVIRKVIRE